MCHERRPLDGRCRVPDREVPVRFLAVILAALVLCSFARAASTHVLHLREHRQVRHLSAYVGTVRFFTRHGWLLQPRATPMRTVSIARRELKQARVWIRVIRRELAETRAALQPRVVAGPSWLWNAFMCIHSHEGSWTDSGAPYWGGLQFGWSEWQRFGGKFAPTANLATPAEQIAAGIAYWRVAGFNPWPATARMCGLL